MADLLEDYFTAEQLAAQLGRGVRTLVRWRALNEGPPITRIGRQILYRKTTVAAWLASLEREVA
jgi:hypothetical protein